RFALILEEKAASLLFRYPDTAGQWQWRREPSTIALPDCVGTQLQAGAPLAPTLRELVKAEGERGVVLELILPVPKTPPADREDMERVLGFDWGVNGLVTAVVLGTQPDDLTHFRQLARPLFVHTREFDGHQARTRRQIDYLQAKQARVPADNAQWTKYER